MKVTLPRYRWWWWLMLPAATESAGYYNMTINGFVSSTSPIQCNAVSTYVDGNGSFQVQQGSWNDLWSHQATMNLAVPYVYAPNGAAYAFCGVPSGSALWSYQW